jgi:hypothetical protein
VSATIHLANRDWGALVEDFVTLGFLPREAGERRTQEPCPPARLPHA